jgi:hypothetical protein
VGLLLHTVFGPEEFSNDSIKYASDFPSIFFKTVSKKLKQNGKTVIERKRRPEKSWSLRVEKGFP